VFETGRSARVTASLIARIIRRLDAIEAAQDLSSLNQPGFNFHMLHGQPRRYSIHVNGPWCITFGWENNNAKRVDLEQYH
jgi:proteic killer suppression protein